MNGKIVAIVSKTIKLNHWNHWIYVQAPHRNKSTLLFLHGGPGWADASMAHRICRLLWDHFNIVHWDQRGASRSGGVSGSMTVDQLVEDGIALTRYLDRNYSLKKPVLVGHSWGSMLGVLMAQKAPELFSAMVGVGQLVSNALSEPLSFDFACKRACELGKEAELRELDAMGSEFYRDYRQMFRQREILFELGGEFKNPVSFADFKSWMDDAPPDYQADFETLVETCEYSIGQLWGQVIQLNLFKQCPALEIPLTILQGRHDYVTAAEPAWQWFQQVHAPRKDFVWFENSAHWPQLEEQEKFSRFITDSDFGS